VWGGLVLLNPTLLCISHCRLTYVVSSHFLCFHRQQDILNIKDGPQEMIGQPQSHGCLDTDHWDTVKKSRLVQQTVSLPPDQGAKKLGTEYTGPGGHSQGTSTMNTTEVYFLHKMWMSKWQQESQSNPGSHFCSHQLPITYSTWLSWGWQFLSLAVCH
jgi:hypothetical protein